MGNKYTEIAFTDGVRDLQEAFGSRRSYAKFEIGPDANDRLGPSEAAFIAARDSFYIASVGETGWPYMQHRGGPPGFIRTLDERTLAFADFRGNRQYVSVGNIGADDRVSLFFMDYANRACLKLFGRAGISQDGGVLEAVALPDYRAHVERALVVEVAAFDWNCPQHITPRYTEEEIARLVAPLHAQIAALKAAGTKH